MSLKELVVLLINMWNWILLKYRNFVELSALGLITVGIKFGVGLNNTANSMGNPFNFGYKCIMTYSTHETYEEWRAGKTAK